VGGADAARSALRWGGLWVFIAPGILGTLLGIMLRPATGVDPGNVLSKVVAVLPSLGPVYGFLLAVTLLACLMSMIDGLLIAAGYALVIDVLRPGCRLDDLDADPATARAMLSRTRVAFVIMALLGSFGITRFIAVLGLNIFDILYFVIIPHLALTGPVFASLHGRTAKHGLVIPLVASAAIGYLAVFIGTSEERQWIVEGAGVFTIVASSVLAFLMSQKAAVVNPPAATAAA
jgi:hypothetical protein